MSRIDEVLNEANERLKVAKCGLTMIKASKGEAKVGLRNVAVFGRMVTFATNNLRSHVEGFEVWDTEAKQRRLQNEHCRYMVQLRNVIEKEARTPVSTNVHVHQFNSDILNRFPRPPGAQAFFIGDQNGGTGWMVAGPDGETVPYYVDLPTDVGNVWFVLPEHGDKNVEDVAEQYIASLEEYLLEVSAFVRGN